MYLAFQKDKSVSLEIANNIYVEKSYDVRDDFLDLIRTNFRAGSSSINFGNNHQAAETINTWVSDVTRNRIRELLSAGKFSKKWATKMSFSAITMCWILIRIPIPSQSDQISKDTNVVLINAVYFKGIWKNAFPPQGLISRPFYINEQDFVDMDMMSQRGNFLYAKIPELDASVALLPYQVNHIPIWNFIRKPQNKLLEWEIAFSWTGWSYEPHCSPPTPEGRSAWNGEQVGRHSASENSRTPWFGVPECDSAPVQARVDLWLY